jgi:hypothetical protein
MAKQPMKRKTPLRAWGQTSYRRRERDFEYMKRVHRLSCAVRKWPWSVISEGDAPMLRTLCGGRIEADHAGVRAKGRKAADNTCIPMCRNHHGERTDYRGAFKNWKGPQMRTWCDYAIKMTTAEVDDMTPAAYPRSMYR